MLAFGYGSTALNQILAQAAVPKGSFYHHFASKEAFAEEVIRQYATGQELKWKRILRDGKLTPIKRLRKYFRQLIKDHGRGAEVSGCLLGIMSLEVAEHNESLRLLVKDAFDHWQDAIANTLSEAVEAHELSSEVKADDLAAIIVSLWEGAQIRAKSELSDRPLELFFRFTFDRLLIS
jgi:TetR/AcrR family transcriptional repressor of nem operon